MHALQFVKKFAAYAEYEHDLATLRVIDRALAEAGLRAKAKGKRMPDITIMEGMGFLLAVLANVQPTRAAERAIELANFRILRGTGVSRKPLNAMARLLRRPAEEVLNMHLIDVLVALGGKLTDSPVDGLWVELTVHRGRSAFLSFGRNIDEDEPLGQLQFCGGVATRIPRSLTESRTAMPELVRWVAMNTVHNPLERAD